MLTLDDENAILDDVEDAVSIALHQMDIDGYVDDIKLNKLAYFLIQDHHLTITYGWYKYGPAPIQVSDHSSGRTTYVEPESPDEISASDTSRMPESEREYKSPEEWSYYFTDEVPELFTDIVQSETKEYLERFYDSYAPEEYKQLYIYSVRLQRHLDEIKEKRTWVDEGDVYYGDVKRGLFDVYGELLRVNQVDEAADPFSDYTELLQDTLIGAREKERLSEAQQEEVVNVINFFYSAAWEWVALLISWNTARGPNKRKLLRSIDNSLNSLRSDFDRELEGLRTKVGKRGLIPEHVEELEELSDSESVVPPNEPEEEVIEGWTALGAEAISDDGSE